MKLNMIIRRSIYIAICLALALASLDGSVSSTVQAQEASPAARQVTRISVSSTGEQGNGQSRYPSISQDGRYVAFMSWASNLVDGDTNGSEDIFVHDTLTGSTTRVSVTSLGGQMSSNPSYSFPVISPNGRYAGFYTGAYNLVPGDTNESMDVFVHDMVSGTTTRASVGSSGQQGNSHSQDISFSADGRYIAFTSNASNFAEGDWNNCTDVFVRDTQTGITTRVSVSSNGEEGNSFSWAPSISADGRYVAFTSEATNFFPNDTIDTLDGFVHDMVTGETKHLPIPFASKISGDGNYVTFSSAWNNLIPGDYDYIDDVFLYDIQAESLQRISVSSSGIPGNLYSVQPSISFDGKLIAFSSYASNLVPDDNNSEYDIFVHNMLTAETKLLSVASDGTQANGTSTFPDISSDGSTLTFESVASNLIPDDTNNSMDIFVVKFFNTSIAINKTGEGVITSIPEGIDCGDACSAYFEDNILISLTATASAGYTFTGWSGDITSTANPLDVTTDANKTITANFTQDEYLLTINTAHGVVTKTPDQPTYHYGDVVHLTASADPTYTFAGWTGDISNHSDSVDITIEGDTSINAVFIQNPRTLTVTSLHGTVTKNPDQAFYEDGDYVQLTALPDVNYSFSNWSGGADGAANPIDLLIQGDTVVTANYGTASYTLSINKSGPGNGIVTSDPVGIDCGLDCEGSFPAGTAIELTAAGSPGWTFTGWSGGGCSGRGTCSIDLHSNITVDAAFDRYKITLPFVTKQHLPLGFNKTSPGTESYIFDPYVTLSWSSSPYAETYEYCLDTIDNNACDTVWVSAGYQTSVTVNNIQLDRTYYWQVRAKNSSGLIYAGPSTGSGSWWNFITPWLPKPGFWFDDYTGTYFFVSPDQNSLREFGIYVALPCWEGWIYKTNIPITNREFSFSGSFYASGLFSARTYAFGSAGLSHWGPKCGYTWSGSLSWNARWIDDSQPTSMSAKAQAIMDAYEKRPSASRNQFKPANIK